MALQPHELPGVNDAARAVSTDRRVVTANDEVGHGFARGWLVDRAAHQRTLAEELAKVGRG